MTTANEITYFPIAFDESFPVYCFEYTQKTFKNRKLHTHNGLEIGVCLEGDGIFFIGNRVLTFEKDSVSFIGQNCPHIAESPDERPSKWIYLTIRWEEFFGPLPRFPIGHIAHDEEMASLVGMIYREMTTRADGYRAVVKALLNALIGKMRRLLDTDAEHPLPMVDPDARESVYPALVYIRENYAHSLPIEELARVNRYSVTHFRRLFKEQTGVSPIEYIRHVRLQAASVLLRTTEKSVALIAAETGFDSTASLDRAFKAVYGESPRPWRRRTRAD